jgi:DNA-binding protein H-NS
MLALTLDVTTEALWAITSTKALARGAARILRQFANWPSVQSHVVRRHQTTPQHHEDTKVPRQFALSSVVKSFEKLAFDQQKEALVQLQVAHERSRDEKRAELERELAALEYKASRRRSRAKTAKKANGTRSKKANGLAHKAAKRGPVKAKYHDTKTGDTWSGRGRMAGWLKLKQDAGEKIEKYLLN